MALPLQALRKPDSLRQQVENALRVAITSGELKPGQRLVERDLCASMDVSRTSLREALRKLEAEKLICIVPNRGPVVASISVQEAKELYAVRALMEGYAARQFALKADDMVMGRLKATVVMLHTIAAKPDRPGLLEAKRAFYDVLLEGCGNALVAEMLNMLLSRINILRFVSFSQNDRLPKTLQEIDHLLDRIAARDSVGAELAAVTHVHAAEIAALAVLQQSAIEMRIAVGSR